MSLKVILADDHNLVREGLRSLLDKQEDIQVVGEADNGRAALELAMRLVPDVAVMDVSMADMNGVEAASRIRESVPEVRVLALSMHADKRFVEKMLKAGASGYMLKNCAFREIAQAIRDVAAGRCYLSPEITGILVDNLVRGSSGSGPSGSRPGGADLLTPREREVLQLLAEGRSSKAISEKLNLSERTVETHRHNIMKKLNIFTVAELTKFAVREGLTTL
jgi:DNA-binding NarL/FixJ family response regulator